MKFKIKKNSIETQDDLEKLEKLEQSIFKESSYSRSTLLEIIKNYDNYTIFSCYSNKEIIAYIIVLNNIDYFEIIKIAVLENYRNMGVGQSLIEMIKEKDTFLEVRQSNEVAIKFYLKNGFKKISLRKNYYKDNNEDAIIMKLEVN
ncbi:MAG: ribosomal protein S18-alanine N-acetyltransferase [Fusobacterium sp.]|uniref:ribosomal protein S18-alanine N-acetyltransferase n=1 Tax=Fusobacterium sp. TaxID=68766 RepID=UPI0026DD8946|nr:ribosomal protein S18-alanine N-acetyltransferase [Fusobacterium sp.]MDO4690491.1 ribosomal protein S18-alanine N-acetyltransferase [Fusobacterium sp.]